MKLFNKISKKGAALLAVVMVLSVFSAASFSTDTQAKKASKVSTKETVLRNSSVSKIGAYTYYILGKNLVKAKSNGKAKVVVKNVSCFEIVGKKIFYSPIKNSKLYSCDKNGKAKKSLAKGCQRFYENAPSGKVVYGGAYGLYIMKTNGKSNTKLLGYSQMLPGFKIFEGRIFYHEFIEDQTGSIVGTNLCSKKLDGKDAKVEMETPKDMDSQLAVMNGKLFIFFIDESAKTTSLMYAYENSKFAAVNTDLGKGISIYESNDGKALFACDYNNYKNNGRKISLFKVAADGKMTFINEFPETVIPFEDGWVDVSMSGKYYVVEVSKDGNYPVSYIINKSGKIAKTIKMPKGKWGVGPTVNVVIKGKKAYVAFTGENSNKKYKVVSL